jgi:transposase-like protein
MPYSPILITCQNPSCDFFMTEFNKKLRRNGHNSAANQQYHCLHCNRYFVETKNTPFYYSNLVRSQVEQLAKFSVENTSKRGVSRITQLSRGTISRYYRLIGEHAARLNESHTANIPSGTCEMDEIWSYVYKKQKK